MAHQMISNMANINTEYRIVDLITALRKFRQLHQTEYKDAIDVFRDDVFEKVTELLDRHVKVKHTLKDFPVNYNLGLVAPVNCDIEYHKLITIFESMPDSQIKLNLAEANRILNNDWEWVEAASTSNAFYTSRKKA